MADNRSWIMKTVFSTNNNNSSAVAAIEVRTIARPVGCVSLELCQ